MSRKQRVYTTIEEFCEFADLQLIDGRLRAAPIGSMVSSPHPAKPLAKLGPPKPASDEKPYQPTGASTWHDPTWWDGLTEADIAVYEARGYTRPTRVGRVP